jgi:protein-S-isoprenylcysteine O-methyltransferase Ste14
MDPKLIVIIAVSFLYGLFEIAMNLRQKSAGRISSAGDRGSLRVLYALITAGYFLSYAIGATRIGRIYAWDTLFAVGVALIVVGFIVRIHAMLVLRQHFTYSVARVDDHRLIETGLYKIIRHPGYLGQLLIFIGISISLSNWLSVLVMTIPIAIAYGYRIKVEERFMLEQLGNEYLDYQHRTKRLIPMIY